MIERGSLLHSASMTDDRRPLILAENNPATALATARERERRQTLLAAEMNHRIKNVFASIQALVRLSGKKAANVADFKRRCFNAFKRSPPRRRTSMMQAPNPLL